MIAPSIRRRPLRWTAWLLAGLVAAAAASAEPYLAVAQGLKCAACHVNPSGGGLRSAAGVQFARFALPAHRLPDELGAWTGRLGEQLRVGGDFRAGVTRTRVPASPPQRESGIDRFRVYADLALLGDRLGLHVDEQLAPGRAQAQEAYLRFSGPGAVWQLKAGQFYLPFGWRLQDQGALVRIVSGIGMTTPDRGIEIGLERDAWSAQLALSEGPGNAGTGSGHQWTAQLVHVQPAWRVGAALAATRSDFGDRLAGGLFGGLRTGPLVWLGEVVLVRDDGYPEGRRRLLAAFGELNWLFRQGHNLKLTGEAHDPDRALRHDHRVRRSLVYEYTPIPFVQLRLGIRRHLGIPQNEFDNRRLAFVELHGLF